MTHGTGSQGIRVLDAPALLAVINAEPGAALVPAVIEEGHAVISAVNLSEVVTKLAGRVSDDGVDATMRSLRVQVHPFLPVDAVRTGTMIRATRHAGLSLADRACMALAQRLAATVLTADRAWSRVDVGVAVELIR